MEGHANQGSHAANAHASRKYKYLTLQCFYFKFSLRHTAKLSATIRSKALSVDHVQLDTLAMAEVVLC